MYSSQEPAEQSNNHESVEKPTEVPVAQETATDIIDPSAASINETLESNAIEEDVGEPHTQELSKVDELDALEPFYEVDEPLKITMEETNAVDMTETIEPVISNVSNETNDFTKIQVQNDASTIIEEPKQAFQEILDIQMDEARLRQSLERITNSNFIIKHPKQFTPLSFPIIADGLNRNNLSNEKLEERILRMQQQLTKNT